jgi:hypothetical protein
MAALSWKRELLAACVLALVLATLLGMRLFTEPVIGIANNGDFERLLCPAGLSYPSHLEWPERYFFWINRTFEVGPVPDNCSLYVVSGSLLVRSALWINETLFAQQDSFDIRVMGSVHCMLYVAAFLVILLSTRHWRLSSRAILFYLMIVVFADVGYVVYMNSFFGEPATLLSFLLSVGLYSLLISLPDDADRRSVARTALAFLVLAALLGSTAFFIASKPQNYIMFLPCVLLCAYLIFARRAWALKLLAAAGMLLLTMLALHLFQQVDRGFARMQLFDVVFLDVVGHSPNPEADLRELGLPEDHRIYLGMAAWQQGSPYGNPEFLREFEKVTYASVARLYLHHPMRFLDDLRRSARQVFDVRVRQKFGHFEPSSGKPGRTQSSSFALWSQARESLFPRRLWFLLLFAVFNLGVIVFKRRRVDRTQYERGVTALHAWLLITGVLAFVTVTAGGGSFAPRHMFLVNVSFDACIVLLVMYLVGGFTPRTATPRR